MGRNKHRIKNDGRDRAILTDLLPYEVPIRFSLLNIYGSIRAEKKQGRWLEMLLRFELKGGAIPYFYSARTSEDKNRRLGLVHPLLFKGFADLYARFSNLMLGLCSRSNWSLRAPWRVATTCYVSDFDDIREGDADPGENPENIVPAEEDGLLQAFASSYFTYKPFSFLERFYTSNELVLLERDFRFYKRFDIARCFDSIYTHSVSWAVKGKQAGKEEKSLTYTFEHKIDFLIRSASHNETNGILVGPEVSRIYAEIILQTIDVRTAAALKAIGLKEGVDFAVRRYIDDYFVFFNEDRIAKEFSSALERNLSSYKLFLNDSKTHLVVRPFGSKKSLLKNRLCILLGDLFSIHPKDLETSKFRCSPNHVVSEIRSTITELDGTYGAVSSCVLKRLFLLFKANLDSVIAAENGRLLSSWLESLLSVAFFIFSVDPRFRTSVLLGRIATEIHWAIRSTSSLTRAVVKDLVLAETIGMLNRVARGQGPSRPEFLNLMICLREFEISDQIPVSLLSKAWRRIGDEHEFDYFCVISLLYFINEDPTHSHLRNEVISGSIARICSVPDLIADCELLSLSLDLLSCPLVSTPQKRTISMIVAKKINTSGVSVGPMQAEELLNEFSSIVWFFDWDSGTRTDIYLRKKELSFSY